MVYIIGTPASETIEGTEDDDSIVGLAGDDHLLGLNGNDRLIGGLGADILDGGDGDDVYDLDRFDTLLPDIGGWDGIRATVTIDLALHPTMENLVMTTDASGRQLLGNGTFNELIDWGGSNLLDGRAGDDYLYAGAGDDILIGGLGIDGLYGAAGDDRFDFYDASETGVGADPVSHRDLVMDFTRNDDTIHLGRIDADEGHSGNQAFRFLGATGFTGTAGELVTYQQYINAGTELVTVLAADTDGDGLADFEIEFRGAPELQADDFIL